MSRFSPLLRRAAARLNLPQPAKSQVLLEMAADMEDLFAAYRQRGLGEAAAMEKVEEKFDVSDATLHELALLHSSAFRRWMARFSPRAQSRRERLLLALILLFVVAMTARLLFSTGFVRDASVFIWPVLAAGLAALGISLAKGYRLYIKKDHTIHRLRRGLPSLLFLAAASLFTGVFGFFVGMRLAMERMAAEIQNSNVHLAGWLLGSTSTMILSLLVAILAALFWFVLQNKVVRIELAEAALVLEEPQ